MYEVHVTHHCGMGLPMIFFTFHKSSWPYSLENALARLLGFLAALLQAHERHVAEKTGHKGQGPLYFTNENPASWDPSNSSTGFLESIENGVVLLSKNSSDKRITEVKRSIIIADQRQILPSWSEFESHHHLTPSAF